MPRRASGSLFQQRDLGPSHKWQRSIPRAFACAVPASWSAVSLPASTATSPYPSGKLLLAFRAAVQEGLLQEAPLGPSFPPPTMPCVPCTPAAGRCQAPCSQRVNTKPPAQCRAHRGGHSFREQRSGLLVGWAAAAGQAEGRGITSLWGSRPLRQRTLFREALSSHHVLPCCSQPSSSPACLLSHTVSYLQEWLPKM